VKIISIFILTILQTAFVYEDVSAEIKLPKSIYVPNSKLISNERTFSGPMGMGLIKSFDYNNKKYCVYNNVKGQQTITLPNAKQNCPKKFGE
tara:strand:+ start:1039 stop:1314 length:276 start_codon:yes stop_codon:yes gene_type:complete